MGKEASKSVAKELECLQAAGVALRAQGRDVIRATIDNFLVPRAQRYRRGRYSAEGCYFDAHDRAALCRVLLDPLGRGGDRRFQHAVFDTDTPPTSTAPADAVLLFDGVFLLRPELIDRWDRRIFVSVPFEQTVDRARARGNALAGSTADTADINGPGATATSLPNSSTSPQPARPTTPTSSCTTINSTGPPGKPDQTH
jgi:hypothetical protein